MVQPDLFAQETENEAKLRHLKEERQWLKDNIDDGCICRVCGQHAKIYKRNFGSAMAVALIMINRAFAEDPMLEWLKVEDYLKSCKNLPATIRGDFPKAVHWGLLEKPGDRRQDGSNRFGFYRMTAKGRDFVYGDTTIPKWVKIFNQEIMGFSEEHVTIKQALQNKFRYDQIMSNEYWGYPHKEELITKE